MLSNIANILQCLRGKKCHRRPLVWKSVNYRRVIANICVHVELIANYTVPDQRCAYEHRCRTSFQNEKRLKLCSGFQSIRCLGTAFKNVKRLRTPYRTAFQNVRQLRTAFWHVQVWRHQRGWLAISYYSTVCRGASKNLGIQDVLELDWSGWPCADCAPDLKPELSNHIYYQLLWLLFHYHNF